MALLILLALSLTIEGVWSPRFDYISEEDMLLMYYNKKYTRGYIIIFKL
jgi:hypothetical protein